MQHLREGIHWRSVGQRDPLVEYRSESQKLFDGLQNALREEVMKIILNLQPNAIAEVSDDKYETELTKMADSATEKGVNEISSGVKNMDKEFAKDSSGITKPSERATTRATASSANGKNTSRNAKRNQARKNKKKARQNKKKGRR